MTVSRKMAQECSGQQAELQLVGFGFDAALIFYFILSIHYLGSYAWFGMGWGGVVVIE